VYEQAVGAVPDRAVAALELPPEGGIVAWEERAIAEGAVLPGEVGGMIGAFMVGAQPTSLDLLVNLLTDLLHGIGYVYRRLGL
jgi:hypothetical protein